AVLGGHYAYVATPRGIAVVDLDDPLRPKIAAQVPLAGARASALQFRYLFVTTDAGLEVVDVTIPEKAKAVEGARIPLADARRLKARFGRSGTKAETQRPQRKLKEFMRSGETLAMGTRRSVLLALLFSVVSVVSVFQPVWAQPLPYKANAKNLGVVNCANSLCH